MRGESDGDPTTEELALGRLAEGWAIEAGLHELVRSAVAAVDAAVPASVENAETLIRRTILQAFCEGFLIGSDRTDRQADGKGG